jgi:hypothetical protein
MATKKKPQPRAATAAASKPAPAAPAPGAAAASAPLNREQRRAQKFGKAGKVHQHDPLGPWPESGINPALSTATAEQAAPADEPARVAPAPTRPKGARAGKTTKT